MTDEFTRVEDFHGHWWFYDRRPTLQGLREFYEVLHGRRLGRSLFEKDFGHLRVGEPKVKTWFQRLLSRRQPVSPETMALLSESLARTMTERHTLSTTLDRVESLLVRARNVAEAEWEGGAAVSVTGLIRDALTEVRNARKPGAR